MSRSSPTLVSLLAMTLLAGGSACGPEAESSSSASTGSRLAAMGARDMTTGYTFQMFDVPGASSTTAIAINDRGVSVGFFLDVSGTRHGFVRDAAGSITTFDVPEAVTTTARGVNAAGYVVGDYGGSDGLDHGFVRAPDGSMTQVDYPGGVNTALVDIDDTGRMVGVYDLGGPEHRNNVFVLQRGVFTALPGAPGAVATSALGTNDLGTITGLFDDQVGKSHGFVLRGGHYEVLDYPVSDVYSTAIWRLNQAGIAVGTYAADTSFGAFLLDVRRRDFTPFECPSRFAVRATGINDSGQIAGACRDYAGAPFHAFVATPGAHE